MKGGARDRIAIFRWTIVRHQHARVREKGSEVPMGIAYSRRQVKNQSRFSQCLEKMHTQFREHRTVAGRLARLSTRS